MDCEQCQQYEKETAKYYWFKTMKYRTLQLKLARKIRLMNHWRTKLNTNELLTHQQYNKHVVDADLLCKKIIKLNSHE